MSKAAPTAPADKVALYEKLVATNPRVDPVADIQRAVRTHGDVGRPEHRLERTLGGGGAAVEVRPRILLLGVGSQEDLAVESEASSRS